jgi:hypothetical protein
MHRGTLAAQHTVSFALLFVVADNGANRRQRIVFKQRPARFIKIAIEHHAITLGMGVWIGQPFWHMGTLQLRQRCASSSM